MELSVYKIDGSESGKKVVLNEEIFGIQPNDHAIYLDVKQYLANQRQGTAKSKDRSEVAYSTKKLIRQKGSGYLPILPSNPAEAAILSTETPIFHPYTSISLSIWSG